MKVIKDIATFLKFWIPAIIFSIFPTLVIYSHNITMLSPAQLIKPICLSIVFMILSCLISFAIFRNSKKAGTFSAVWILLFFSYGYLYLKLGDFLSHFQVSFGTNKILLTLYLIVLIIFAWKLIKTSFFENHLFSFLMVISLTLLSMNLINIVPFEINRSLEKIKFNNYVDQNLNEKMIDAPYSNVEPDVYYIIFDRYARQDVLKSEFNFDNSAQLEYLNEKGFFIGTNSNANYLSTYLSLSSSLNITKLDFLSEIMQSNKKDQQAIYKNMIQSNFIARFFKSRGYKYILAGSFWDPTKNSEIADENVNVFNDFDEFYLYIYERTLFNALVGMFSDRQVYSGVERLNKLSQNLDYQLGVLNKKIEEPDPKFVFAHFLMPHAPTSFSKECEPLTFEQIRELSAVDGYLGEIECSNKVMRQLTEKIMMSSNRPAVIIFQSDEGAFAKENFGGSDNELYNSNLDFHRTHAAILNAIYLPDKNNVDVEADYQILGFESTTSPINTFRIILNYYFGTDLPILEDSSHYSPDLETPYKFDNLEF